MKVFTHSILKQLLKRMLVLSILAWANLVQAEIDWVSVTMDNDSFIGNDDGYTNGFFVSTFDSPEGENIAEIGWLARAMSWSLLDSNSSVVKFDIKTIGQSMITPSDIEQDPPTLPPNDLPYGGLLFYSDTFVQIHQNFADKINVTVGVVGEYSLADKTQEFVHGVVGAADPCCWDKQLDNEVVFQVGRSRVWKTWVSGSGNADFLLSTDLQLGTISSSIGTGFLIRYGRRLGFTYASTLLTTSRTINPIATKTGWYVFAGVRASYLANHIFLNGSKSYDDDFEKIDYKKGQISSTAGLAYSWKDWSLTIALNDMNIAHDDNLADDYTKYGTMTLSWKLD